MATHTHKLLSRLRPLALLAAGFLLGAASVGHTTGTPRFEHQSASQSSAVPATVHFADAVVLDTSKPTQVFYLPKAPNPPASLILVKNGVVQSQFGEGKHDYVLSGNKITMLFAMHPGDQLFAWYRY